MLRLKNFIRFFALVLIGIVVLCGTGYTDWLTTTFVDEVEITGSRVLHLGQTIRIGTSQEELQLIACRDANEGKKSNHI